MCENCVQRCNFAAQIKNKNDMKLDTANVDYAKGEYTYIVSYMTKHDRKDHYEIFPSDDSNVNEATTRYLALLNDEDVYMASMSIEIATTECR